MQDQLLSAVGYVGGYMVVRGDGICGEKWRDFQTTCHATKLFYFHLNTSLQFEGVRFSSTVLGILFRCYIALVEGEFVLPT